MLVNAFWEPLEFEIPPAPELIEGGWKRWIDTSLESPSDICSLDQAEVVSQGRYTLPSRSLAVMLGRFAAPQE
jgi:glycogen operon protein